MLKLGLILMFFFYVSCEIPRSICENNCYKVKTVQLNYSGIEHFGDWTALFEKFHVRNEGDLCHRIKQTSERFELFKYLLVDCHSNNLSKPHSLKHLITIKLDSIALNEVGRRTGDGLEIVKRHLYALTPTGYEWEVLPGETQVYKYTLTGKTVGDTPKNPVTSDHILSGLLRKLKNTLQDIHFELRSMKWIKIQKTEKDAVEFELVSQRPIPHDLKEFNKSPTLNENDVELVAFEEKERRSYYDWIRHQQPDYYYSFIVEVDHPTQVYQGHYDTEGTVCFSIEQYVNTNFVPNVAAALNGCGSRPGLRKRSIIILYMNNIYFDGPIKECKENFVEYLTNGLAGYTNNTVRVLPSRYGSLGSFRYEARVNYSESNNGRYGGYPEYAIINKLKHSFKKEWVKNFPVKPKYFEIKPSGLYMGISLLFTTFGIPESFKPYRINVQRKHNEVFITDIEKPKFVQMEPVPVTIPCDRALDKRTTKRDNGEQSETETLQTESKTAAVEKTTINPPTVDNTPPTGGESLSSAAGTTIADGFRQSPGIQTLTAVFVIVLGFVW